MAKNRVYDEHTKTVLFSCDTLQQAVDWMMARKDKLEPHGVYADEIDDEGNILGWWELADLIDDNVV